VRTHVPSIPPWSTLSLKDLETELICRTDRPWLYDAPVTDRVRARIEELGLTLYGPHPPHDPLDAVVVHDGVARTSGQLPRIAGELTCLGTLGESVDVAQGSEAAKVCALNALAVLEVALGSLDRIQRVLTVTGYVASAPGFHEQPAVIDGASRVLYEIFGDAGRHTRSAIGVAALPRGGAVEIEVVVAVRED
jgi:enamine deaminase RidA (YjgF/YER057c/UK114 family)